MRWTRQGHGARRRGSTNDADADGEVVWSWRPDAGVKLAGFPANDGGKKARSHVRSLLLRRLLPQPGHVICGELRWLGSEAGGDVIGDGRDFDIGIGVAERRH